MVSLDQFFNSIYQAEGFSKNQISDFGAHGMPEPLQTKATK